MARPGPALPAVVWDLAGEASFKERARRLARGWRSQAPGVLLVGLEGPLGVGKTTWVRGMLEGLGYRGRVSSPTYTLLQHYELGDVTVVHIDLYRLSEADAAARHAWELEAIGVKDWLARPDAWLLVEWPVRSPQLTARCDVRIGFEFTGAAERRATLKAHSPVGESVLGGLWSDSA